MKSLKDKVILITGASRGIGKAIGVRAAQEGAKIVIASKTTDAHPTLPGTIYTAAEDMMKAGASDVLPVKLDVRHEEEIQDVVAQVVEKFSGIDVLVNNAGAIFLAPLDKMPVKRIDLVMQVNVRASLLMAQACLPFLKQSDNAHIVNLSPPINLDPKWFKDSVAYSISKYGMSMAVLGLAAAHEKDNIAVNALWPRTVIATAAIEMLQGMVQAKNCRTEEIMADAACQLFTQDEFITGQFLIDEDFLREAGVQDFSKYAVEQGQDLMPDFFI